MARKISIAGLLVPSNWDKSGSILEMTLLTADEESYELMTAIPLTELDAMTARPVIVTGRIQDDGSSMKKIDVSSIHLAAEEN